MRSTAGFYEMQDDTFASVERAADAEVEDILLKDFRTAKAEKYAVRVDRRVLRSTR